MYVQFLHPLSYHRRGVGYSCTIALIHSTKNLYYSRNFTVHVLEVGRHKVCLKKNKQIHT